MPLVEMAIQKGQLQVGPGPPRLLMACRAATQARGMHKVFW